jgi:hypothetical protein
LFKVYDSLTLFSKDGLTVSLIIAISLMSLSFTPQLVGLAQEQQPAISICQEELNKTKCNQIEPVCPETFPR